MNRIALFLATNMAILLVLSISMSIFGIDGILDEQGVDLNLILFYLFQSVIGFAGAFISLAFLNGWQKKYGRSFS